tara:strand:+ start:247 stop:561 length:315 start_codon:yes stop_codon:yes gene_type:complete
MNPQAAKAIHDVLQANQLTNAFTCMLLQCQELALAINLQRKYAVQLETSQHGIFCDTWLATRNAQHESHRQFACFYSRPNRQDEIFTICEHLTALLHDSAGGAA